MVIRQPGEMSWRQLGTRKSTSGLKVEQTNKQTKNKNSKKPRLCLLPLCCWLARGSHRSLLECTCSASALRRNLNNGCYYSNFVSLFCCNLSVLIPFLLFQPWSKNALRMSASPCERFPVTSGTKPSPWLCSSSTVFSESSRVPPESSAEGRGPLWRHQLFLSCQSLSRTEGRGSTVSGVIPGFSAASEQGKPMVLVQEPTIVSAAIQITGVPGERIHFSVHTAVQHRYLSKFLKMTQTRDFWMTTRGSIEKTWLYSSAALVVNSWLYTAKQACHATASRFSPKE